MHNQKLTWTDELLVELRKYVEDGLSGSQIAKLLNTTRNSVLGKIHRLGLQLKGASGRFPEGAARTGGIASIRKRGLKPRVAAAKAAPMVCEPLPVIIERGAGRAVSLMDAKLRDCRAVLDTSDGAVLFCGHTTGFNWKGQRSSYCPEHHALYFVTPTSPQERRARHASERAA
jgi:GcrA cell cycle regulator